MKVARKLFCALIMVTVLCMAMATTAFAAEDGNLWLNVAEVEEGNATVTIVADTTVTNGHLEVSYDSDELTYEGVEVSAEYVDVYAVNTDTAGVIKLAWVAPGAYEADGEACLITIRFTSTVEQVNVTVSGNVYDVDGDLVEILDALDTSALRAAIAKAEALDETVYTEESFAAVEEALEAAKAVLADTGATQEEVDAAAKTLNDAIAALEKHTQGDDSADTGDNVLPVMGLMMLSAMGMGICLVAKKGWWAK